MAATLSLGEIKRRLAESNGTLPDAFDILRSLCAYVSTPDTEQRGQDLLLRALERRGSFGPAASILDGLVRQVGLFPYLEPAGLSLADNIAYEFHLSCAKTHPAIATYGKNASCSESVDMASLPIPTSNLLVDSSKIRLRCELDGLFRPSL